MIVGFKSPNDIIPYALIMDKALCLGYLDWVVSIWKLDSCPAVGSWAHKDSVLTLSMIISSWGRTLSVSLNPLQVTGVHGALPSQWIELQLAMPWIRVYFLSSRTRSIPINSPPFLTLQASQNRRSLVTKKFLHRPTMSSQKLSYCSAGSHGKGIGTAMNPVIETTYKVKGVI